METIDASIPMGFTGNIDPLKRMQMQQMQQQMQTQNALKMIMANPQNWQNGQLTPQAQQQVYGNDPQFGMQMEDAQALRQRRQVENMTAIQQRKLDTMHQQAGLAMSAYQAAKDSGMPEDQAVAAGQKAYTSGLGALRQSGDFSPQDIERLPPQFNPQAVQNFTAEWGDLVKQRRADQAQQRQDTMAEQRVASERASTAHQAEMDKERGWVPFERTKPDGTKELIYVNPGKHEAVTADGKPTTTDGQITKVGPAAKPADKGGEMSDDAARTTAFRIMDGDMHALTGIGRGGQGPANIAKINNTIAEELKNRGMGPEEAAAFIVANQAATRAFAAGEVSAERANSMLVRSANNAIGFIGQAKEAMSKVPRTQFVPFNQLQVLIDKNTSSPEQYDLGAALNSFIFEWAKVLNPNGVVTVEAVRDIKENISQYTNPKALNAVLDRAEKEIAMLKGASPARREEARKSFLEEMRKNTPGAGAIAQPMPTSPATPTTAPAEKPPQSPPAAPKPEGDAAPATKPGAVAKGAPAGAKVAPDGYTYAKDPKTGDWFKSTTKTEW